MNKAVFLDKDGTLIPDIPYNVDPQLITLQADSVAGLKKLQDAGYLLIIISNQSGVARGLFEEDKLTGVEQRLKDLLSAHLINLNGFYYCPHHPDGTLNGYNLDCDCRKPAPGMLLAAAIDHNIDIKQSWMIGDILNDVEAGKRAGCKAVLIDNGNETEWLTGSMRHPDFSCPNIDEAAQKILSYNGDERLAKL
ncbi:HAD family hydrolase [Mucilaginibacter roseus]|uniref:D,D-heptose 1,7-bisphosphate phosphatase n=1 Tax=Mucilaginibacter roseus TaxID=1528868 RepID=A0ABS8U7N7_9SPHI|nr:HAD family hydrolase [Mucilaginibacter roseus]MCD8742170.1 HAD family hydrolase [Mucilaginibacter roseus]